MINAISMKMYESLPVGFGWNWQEPFLYSEYALFLILHFHLKEDICSLMEILAVGNRNDGQSFP